VFSWKLISLGPTQLGEEGVVWAGEARPNYPDFLPNCVSPNITAQGSEKSGQVA
jgi:hypothetical protein